MRVKLAAVLGLSLTLVVACTSETEPDASGGNAAIASGGMASGGGTAGAPSDGGAKADGGSPAAGGQNAGGGSATAPAAPTMESVMKMAGSLHVAWTNNEDDCDKVLLYRNEDGGAFLLEYTLAGAATDQHDAEASDSAKEYCFKARCERDDIASEDSNEKCGTP